MSHTPKSAVPNPLAFLPVQGKPEQLFVLLHGESASPEQLQSLAQAIKHAFPLALIVLPYGPVRGDDSTYHWLDPVELVKESELACVTRALPALVARIQQLQAEYGLSGEQTALAGFSQGATMALEAILAQPDLAGRVIAFSGNCVSPLTAAPLATTLHLLHGENDAQIPLEQVQKLHARLAGLEGDATLDVASDIGHELHSVLIGQAIHRLQTCVPLHRWEAALTGLGASPTGKTLH